MLLQTDENIQPTPNYRKYFLGNDTQRAGNVDIPERPVLCGFSAEMCEKYVCRWSVFRKFTEYTVWCHCFGL